jgi:hypothetical protein
MILQRTSLRRNAGPYPFRLAPMSRNRTASFVHNDIVDLGSTLSAGITLHKDAPLKSGSWAA